LLREKNDIEVVVNEEGEGDIFHCHTYGPYYFWKGRKYKGRRVYTVHVIPDSVKGSLPIWKVSLPVTKWYLKKVHSYADVCIAISPTVEKAIEDSGADTRIVKIYNPINIDKWKRTEEKRQKGREIFGLGINDFVVLGSGQLEGRKGVEDYIDIAEAIPEAKFIWVGGRPFGPLTEGIIRIHSRIVKAPKHVKFHGQVALSEMPFMYAAADMLLFPSYQENCPLAPIEAAASGMPVVYRDIPEYVALYKYPYLKAGTTSEFIELTKRLIHDQSFYKEGQRISEQLITQFDKNRIREELIDLYQSLMVSDKGYHQLQFG
jgi:1,2-diacylglycerol-3-alpha-glucose alpha-1,2-galactosyltransferase